MMHAIELSGAVVDDVFARQRLRDTTDAFRAIVVIVQ
jgi:hypothetical protein